MVGSFLARGVVDEVLAPAFLSDRNNTHPGDCVVEKAVSLLSREHCTARLEKVWGPGDGRPVSELKGVMDQLLKVRKSAATCYRNAFYGTTTDINLLSLCLRSTYCRASLTKPPVASANSKLITSTMS